MNEGIQLAMKDYFDGKVSEEEAWENFYTIVQEKYQKKEKNVGGYFSPPTEILLLELVKKVTDFIADVIKLDF